MNVLISFMGCQIAIAAYISHACNHLNVRNVHCNVAESGKYQFRTLTLQQEHCETMLRKLLELRVKLNMAPIAVNQAPPKQKPATVIERICLSRKRAMLET
jgi:hypothetical protein